MKTFQEYAVNLLRFLEGPPDEQIPAGISDSEISLCEARLGILFPEKLREWLGYSNGPCVGPGGMMGVKTVRDNLDIEVILDLHPTWKEKGWLPVAGDGCGNYYVLVISNPKESPVAFVDTMEAESELAYVVASDFWRFLFFLFRGDLRESRWPFDKVEFERMDPEIFHLGLPLPWDDFK
jgi:cell wall assembly regulator SMI1